MGDHTEPTPSSYYRIEKSKIHGKGVISIKPIPLSTKVDTISIREAITPWLGAWINHSTNPTGVMMKLNQDWIFVASVNIPKGEELTVNYWQTPHFIAKPPELNIKD
jgi:hypothetical protein